MTSFSPGQRPPQVTIPHASFAGSKKSIRLGPADSIAGGTAPLCSQAFIPSRVES